MKPYRIVAFLTAVALAVAPGCGDDDDTNEQTFEPDPSELVVEDDNATTMADMDVSIDVLNNDSTADGETMTIIAVTQPSHGTTSIDSSTNQAIYTPDAGFTGTDSFEYTVEDSLGNIATGVVTVDVTADTVSPRPQDDATTTQAGSATVINVLLNDTDPDGDLLQVVSVTNPSNGQATIGIGDTITYTPDAGFTGIDSFDYTVSDQSGNTGTATVTVDVVADNAAPVAQPDFAVTQTDVAVSLDPRNNDSDPDGDALQIIAVSSPTHGDATLGTGGTVIYTPASAFTGEDFFNYTVSDGSAQTTGVVEVNVGLDTPIANTDRRTVAPGGSVIIDVLANDGDPEGQAITILNFDTASVEGGTVAESGTSLQYTAPAGALDHDSFTYTISDPDGNTATATVFIFIDMMRMDGLAQGQSIGMSFAEQLDLDGDGNQDLVIGAPFDDTHGTDRGAVYIFYGPVTSLDLRDASSVLLGRDWGETAGRALANAGDVNGDGVDDLLIGGEWGNTTVLNTGVAYLVYGGSRLPAQMYLAHAGVIFEGENGYDLTGRSVSAADVNGDGYSDVIIGAWGQDEAGEESGAAYLIYGHAQLAGKINLADADVKFLGEHADDKSGFAVQGIRDFNGDGYGEVAMSAYVYDGDGWTRGATWIFYGGTAWESRTSMADADVRIVGEMNAEELGWSLTSGDFDGDGLSDIAIGTIRHEGIPETDGTFNAHRGAVFLFYGRSDLAGNYTAETDADIAWMGASNGTAFAHDISLEGDWNGDGTADLLIGAPYHGWPSSGALYVVPGSTARQTGTAEIEDWRYVVCRGIEADDELGYAVGYAGDITGDGQMNLLIGAPRTGDNGPEAPEPESPDTRGAVYILK